MPTAMHITVKASSSRIKAVKAPLLMALYCSLDSPSNDADECIVSVRMTIDLSGAFAFTAGCVLSRQIHHAGDMLPNAGKKYTPATGTMQDSG